MTILGTVLKNESPDNCNHELVLRERGGQEKFAMHIVNNKYELVRGISMYGEVLDGMPMSAGKFQGISFEDGCKIYECKDDTGVSCRLSIKGNWFKLDTLKPLLTHKIKRGH